MKRFLPLALAFLTLACRTTKLDHFEPEKSVVYKTFGDADLKLHIFHPAQGPMKEPRPAIVFFFGGGWRKGDPRQFYPQCAYLASRGMLAISAEYRVEERHDASPRDCVEDGKSAVRWIRRHARELGVDPDRVAAGGGSAGGHVAAVAGMTDMFNDPDEDSSVSSRPNALVLFNPVIDTGSGAKVRERMQGYHLEISPLHNVDADTPPMALFLGGEDHLVSAAEAREFKRLIEANGGRCDLHLYEGQAHGFFNFRRGPEFFVKTMEETDRFLQSLGFLPELAHVDVAAWLENWH